MRNRVSSSGIYKLEIEKMPDLGEEYFPSGHDCLNIKQRPDLAASGSGHDCFLSLIILFDTDTEA